MVTSRMKEDSKRFVEDVGKLAKDLWFSKKMVRTSYNMFLFGMQVVRKATLKNNKQTEVLC